MNREKSLIKNTLIISLGTFVPQLLNFITIPILTGCLTTQEYGTYDLLITVVALLLPIASLQIQSAAFRFLIDVREDKEQCKSIISNIVIFILLISVVVLFVFYFFLHGISVINRILIIQYLFLDVLYNTFGQIIRGLSDNKCYAIASMIISVIKTILLYLLVYTMDMGLTAVLLAFVISYVFSVIYLFFGGKIYQYIQLGRVSFGMIKDMLAYSWPMVPNNLSGWVLKMSDRLVITSYMGTGANAVYAAANNIPNIVNLARNVFIMAWQENASVTVSDDDATAYYSKMFKTVFSIVSGVTAALIAVTPILFFVLIKGNYDEAYYQMPILFLGFFFGCISGFQGGIYVAHKKTKAGGLSMLVAAIVNLVVDILLIRYIGIYAASISTLVSYFLLFVYRMLDIPRFQKMQYYMKQIIFEIIILAIMCVVCWFNSPVLNMINFVVGISFCIIINRDICVSVCSRILRRKK